MIRSNGSGLRLLQTPRRVSNQTYRALMIFQVNGAVVSVRPKGDKIGMWLGDSTASESITTVGRRVKERLGIDPQVSCPL